MTVKWAVAKYVSDLQRQEPRNVGVVLWAEDGVCSRFLGERDDGSLDGRRLRWAGSSDTFKAWVAYWRYQFAQGRDIGALLRERPDDNYLLSPGGERVVGSQGLDKAAFLDYLFSTLVEEEPERAGPSVVELAEDVLARTGIGDRVSRDVRVDLPDDAVTFDYRYDNGKTSYLQRVGLIYDDERSWDVVHAVAWAFRAVMERSDSSGSQTAQFVALVKARIENEDLDHQLHFLRPLCQVVDLAEPEHASKQLSEVLGAPSLGEAGPFPSLFSPSGSQVPGPGAG